MCIWHIAWAEQGDINEDHWAHHATPSGQIKAWNSLDHQSVKAPNLTIGELVRHGVCVFLCVLDKKCWPGHGLEKNPVTLCRDITLSCLLSLISVL